MRIRYLLAVSAMSVAASAQAQPGALDTSFSGDGRTMINWGNGPTEANYAYAVATQSDGKIVVVGSGGYTSSATTGFAVQRLNADGSIDATFGSNGHAVVTTTLYGDETRTARAVAIQSDGKIVVAGDVYSTYAGHDYSAAAFRLNSNGSVDTTFAPTTGDHVWQFTSVQTNPVMRFNAVAIQSNGSIVLAGEGSDGVSGSAPPSKFMIVRLLPDGSFDTSFAGTGCKMVPFAIRDVERSAANSLALQSDGKIVVAGEALASDDDYDFAVLRLNANGTLDSGFGYYGQTTIAFDLGGSATDRATGVVVQRSGKIVAAGTVTAPNGDHTIIGMTRLNDNGTLDTTFASGGIFHSVYAVQRIGHDATTAGLTQSPIDDTLWLAGKQVMDGTWGLQPSFGYLRADVNGNVLNSGIVDPCANLCNGYGGSSAAGIFRDIYSRLILVGTGNWVYPGFLQQPIHDFAIVRLESL